MHYSITIPHAPPAVTAQQKGVFVRNGRVHFFTKPKVRKMMEEWCEYLRPLREQIPHTYDGAVALEVSFYYPYPSNATKTQKQQESPHTSRPDLDNVEKGLLDAMSEMGFWCDDSQVAYKQTRKMRSTNPRVEISIEDYYHD